MTLGKLCKTVYVLDLDGRVLYSLDQHIHNGIDVRTNLSKPIVAVVKSEGHYKGTKKALSLIESQIEESIKGKRSVLVKPNFVSTSRQLAATHVDSVRATLDTISKYYHGRITIGEGPALGDMKAGISNFGYSGLADEYSVDFIDLNEDEYVLLDGLDRNLELMQFRISKTIVEYDYLISVAKPKTHDCVIATLSIKNVVVGSLVTKHEKDKIHQGTKAINLNIANLAQQFMPDLAVIDGYFGMEGEGPVNGSPVELGVSAASLYPVSLDAVMANIMGFKPLEIGYLYHLMDWGVGIAEIGGIDIIGEPIKNIVIKFKPHSSLEDQLKWR